ncbi:MAG: NADH-quinone oxidoreductase subunit H [Leptonema sp. (in: Bacteria)]|nr:NADH-quinone oxidoreductase subunit H [Leptonema sp. (in: bacteria)]
MTPLGITLINTAVMALIGWIIVLQLIPVLIWFERKGAAIIQDRWGPIRANIGGVRLFGMLHNIADVIKLLMKEDVTPNHVQKFYYYLAPFWSMTVALLPMMLIPLAAPVDFGDTKLRFAAGDYESGLLMIFAITGLSVFAVILAGWASNNKYSMLGGLRSSAQMISYELAIGLSIVAILMVYKTLHITSIVEQQGQLLNVYGFTLPLPNWGVVNQPIAFIVFLTALFAETNRTPFDLAESESELVAGYHTEYSSMKFALFFMAEYGNMIVGAFVVSTLFFGGYQVPYMPTDMLRANPHWALTGLLGITAVLAVAFGIMVFRRAPIMKALIKKGAGAYEYYAIAFVLFGAAVLALAGIGFGYTLDIGEDAAKIITIIFQVLVLSAKAIFFCWFYIQVRWTLPRFRYDQLMNLGWKILIPVSLLNILVTGTLKIL